VANQSKYLYGPVPSRRLGRSLGVDIVPFKTCTLDCVYCQLGKTACKTIQRKEYVSVEDVLAEIKQNLDVGPQADYITIGGSGEPTLHSGIGRLIEGIKKLTKIPAALLTNGTLFYLPQVRADCAGADVILPSLDAGDEATFNKVNRPVENITFNRLVDGLCDLRKEYRGLIWLEVFLIERFNTDSPQIAKIADAISRICPDKVHLNTAVRPTAEPGIDKVQGEKLESIARQLGHDCEVIADFVSGRCGKSTEIISQTLLSILKRRPCSLNDLCSVTGLSAGEVMPYIETFEKQGTIHSEIKSGQTFFKVR
jgi:wyosine [tRNA(Phe)-imidazoG37] synthetase (radical SAM superfamily)